MAERLVELIHQDFQGFHPGYRGVHAPGRYYAGTFISTQKQQINRLLGRVVLDEFSVAPVPQPTIGEADMNAARHRVLEQRPEVREALLKIEQARVGRRIKKSEYIPAVSDKLRKLEQSRLDLRVAELGQETAREMRRVNTEKYRAQNALLSEVLQTQASLADADHQYQQALLAVWAAKAEFEKTLGDER